jgi:probable F420-dependent oxidoreductase
MDLGPVGIWWSGSWRADGAEAAAEMEELGYTTLWTSNGIGPGLSKVFDRLLAATRHAVVASGIASVWHTPAANIIQAVDQLEPTRRERFLLGLGTSHAVLVEPAGERYERPYSRVVDYLDVLDSTPGGVGVERRVLAALRPRMLRLAADRALGAHPYFVPVEHTARAREVIGHDALLAPEVAVVLDTDPGTARQRARQYCDLYLGLPNYANNLRALAWTDVDLDHGGSDRLIDAIVPWGDPQAIAARVREHRAAGADHVCVQVVAELAEGFPVEAYRRLAPALVA